jgi:multiple sugar transport system permease protein
VTVIPVFIFLRDVGLLDTRLGVILPMAASGFGAFMMRQFMLQIPQSLIDAARLDGCSDLRIFWHVVLPLMRPAIASLAIFTFLGAWDAFLWPLVLLSSDANATLPLGLSRFNEEYLRQPHYTMAVATISIAPVVLLFLLAQRSFIRGATMAGLKG